MAPLRCLHYAFCLLLLALPAALAPASAAGLSGAGASFAAPVLLRWAQAYEEATGVRVGYRAGGSAEGIRQAAARTVDFALTDLPLSVPELQAAGLEQFPLVAGGVVPVAHLPGLRGSVLHLSGAVLADLFLGRITRWNDPALVALNPGLDLPDLAVTPIHRADGSGSTFLLASYLSRVSPAWAQALGTGSRLAWPAGQGASGSEGMARAVEATAGALGYLDHADAAASALALAQLPGEDGSWLGADAEGFAAAVAAARWNRPAFQENLAARAGPGWPLTGITYALLPQGRPAERAQAVRAFFGWIQANGAGLARTLRYVPLEDPELIARIQAGWSRSAGGAGQGGRKP